MNVLLRYPMYALIGASIIFTLANTASAQIGNGKPAPGGDVIDNSSSSTFGNFEVGLPGGGSFRKGQSIDSFIQEASNAPIKTLVNYFVTFAIGILVIIGVITIVIGGYLYMTAAGNASQVGAAKEMITSALIGIFIAFISVVILNTINPYLGSKAVEPSLSPQPATGGNSGGVSSSGSNQGNGSSSGSGNNSSNTTNSGSDTTGSGTNTSNNNTSQVLFSNTVEPSTPKSVSVVIDGDQYYIRDANGFDKLSSKEEVVSIAQQNSLNNTAADHYNLKIYRTLSSRAATEVALTDAYIAAGIPSDNVQWINTPLQ